MSQQSYETIPACASARPATVQVLPDGANQKHSTNHTFKDNVMYIHDDISQPDVEATVFGITLWQPYASLIALGLKQYETRSWATSYRGKLLIHSAQRPIDFEGPAVVNQALSLSGQAIKSGQVQKYGYVVASAEVTDCLLMLSGKQFMFLMKLFQHLFREVCGIVWQGRFIFIFQQLELERAVGDWQPKRYAWKLENIQPLEKPIPCLR